MALRGVNLSETEDYIHPTDPGHPDHEAYKKAIAKDEAPEEPTVYKIGNLTQNDRIYIGDLTNTPSLRDGQMIMNSRNTKRAYEIVRRGLKGWDNQLDHMGNKVGFKFETMQDQDGDVRPCASEESLRVLTRDVIFDLSNKISEKNGMTNDLVKKFSGASSLPGVNLSEIGDVPTVTPTSEKNEDVQPPLSSELEPSQNTNEPKVSTGTT